MATIRNRGNYSQIQFRLDGKGKTLTLPPKTTKGTIEQMKELVETIIKTRKYGLELDPDTRIKIGVLPDEMQERFVKCALIPPPPKTITVKELWDGFFEDRADLAPNTLETYQTTRKHFEAEFPLDSDPEKITVKMARAFRRKLQKKYSPATVWLIIGQLRTVFSWGIEEETLKNNVWKKVERGDPTNKDREHYISPKDYLAVLGACPSQEWRTFISFMRMGGLRREEALAMRWRDIDWEKEVMKVYSTKTKRHKGHEYRIIPIFPELMKELNDLWTMAEEGDIYLFKELRQDRRNDHWYFFRRKILPLTGLTPWPRAFHNLRGSRANELYRDFPFDIASYWMGQSYEVAIAYYLNFQRPDIISKGLSYLTVKPEANEPNLAINLATIRR